MKHLRLLILLPLLLLLTGSVTQQHLMVIARKNVAAPPASGWTEEITDTFSSDSAPPTGWTEINGSWAVSSGVIAPDDLVPNRTIVSNSTVSTATQFVKVQFSTVVSDSYDGMVFRQASGNIRYVIRYAEQSESIEIRCTTGTNTHSTFHTQAITPLTASDYLAVTVEGTNTSTEFKFWINPDAGATPDLWGAADYTVNSGNWDGAPSVYHDSGVGVGLFAGGGTLKSNMDNFSAGSYE